MSTVSRIDYVTFASYSINLCTPSQEIAFIEVSLSETLKFTTGPHLPLQKEEHNLLRVRFDVVYDHRSNILDAFSTGRPHSLRSARVAPPALHSVPPRRPPLVASA